MSIRKQKDLKVMGPLMRDDEEKKIQSQDNAPQEYQQNLQEGFEELKLEELGAEAVWDAEITKNIRSAHRELHKKDASDKKQKDKREAYERKMVLQSGAKEVLADRKEARNGFFDSFSARLQESQITLKKDEETRERVDVIQCMSVLYQDDMARSQLMYENLSVDTKTATAEQVVAKRRELERIFAIVMELDLKEFEFKNPSDLIAGNIEGKQQYLALCPQIFHLIKEYQEIMPMNAGCVMSERMVKELEARAGLMQKFKNAYDLRLNLMSNKYYALLLREDTEDMSGEKLTEKYVRAMDSGNAELTKYLSLVIEQRNQRKSKINPCVERGESAGELLERERKRVGLKGGEGLENPGMVRLRELKSGGIEQLDSRQLKIVMNTKRMEKKENLTKDITDIQSLKNLPKDVKKVLAGFSDYLKTDIAAAFGGQKRQARRKASPILNTLKYGMAILFRMSDTGNKVESERHNLRIAIKKLREVVTKYSAKDPNQYGEMTQKLSNLLNTMENESGTPLEPLTEEKKEEAYKKRGWTRKEGEFKELDRRGRKRHTIEDDDMNGSGRWLMENNFEVDARKSVLFAHEPCIEDISQGAMGDCYFLSALGALVQKNPQNIRDMMMDNGDGSVTVRFFDQTDNFKPMYITVSKRVRLTGASHTVWVQVMEKAYTCYLQEIHNNILILDRDGEKDKVIDYDPNLIEYGFISRGGNSNNALEAMTGQRGTRTILRSDSTLKISSVGEVSNMVGKLLNLSFMTTDNERELKRLRREELWTDRKLANEADIILGNEDEIEGYEHIWERLAELDNQSMEVMRKQAELAAQENKAEGEEKTRISNEIDKLTEEFNDIFDEQQRVRDQFREEYIANNCDIDETHVKKDIEDLKSSIQEDNNVLSGVSGPLINIYREEIKSIKDVNVDLYLDKSVDTKLSEVRTEDGKKLAPLVRVRVQRSIADLSQKMAVSLLSTGISMLDLKDFEKISKGEEQKKYNYQLPYEILGKLKDTYEKNESVIEDLYRESTGQKDLENIRKAAEESRLSEKDFMDLVEENKNIIIKNMFAKIPDLKKYCYEETGAEHPYSQIEEEEFNRIKEAIDRGSYVGASTGGSPDFSMSDPAGINNNHAYAVLGTSVDEKGRKFVIVRDPAGGAGATYEADGKTIGLSEDESYGVNKMELHHFLNRFEDLIING